MKLVKRICATVLIFALGSSLAACGEQASDDEGREATLYFINTDETDIVEESYVLKASEDDVRAEIKELLEQVVSETEGKNRVPLLPSDVKIKTYQYADEILTLDMNEQYAQMSISRELLTRWGLVSTFTQLEGLKGVRITVGGEPLTDSYGSEVGVLTGRSFAARSGSNVNSYQSKEMTLYFTDESGSYLVPETRRVYFSSSEPVEQAVVKEVLRGPQGKGHYPTYASDTNLLSVLTADKICYVNFDESVANTVLSVNNEVSIYSIVNSLVINCHVEKVQFSIEGSSDVLFRDGVDLSEQFTENQDLVEIQP